MAKKKAESIWTKDITPDIVGFMTQDITPDFSGDLWTKDITHHIVGVMAVFGLVVSSFVATLGVAAVSVNVEMAFAQQAASSQTAALVMAENHMPPPMVGSTTAPRPPKMEDHMGSSTEGRPAKMDMGSTTPMSCAPLLIARTLKRGVSGDDVTKLQNQLVAEGLISSSSVTGFFGPLTEKAIAKWQQAQGIASSSNPDANQGIGMVGPRTRALFAKCEGRLGQLMSNGSKSLDFDHGSSTMGTSTMPKPPKEMHGSTTLEQHPKPPMPPKATTTPTGVSFKSDTSNAASIIEAVNQIGDGYSKLILASLSFIGL